MLPRSRQFSITFLIPTLYHFNTPRRLSTQLYTCLKTSNALPSHSMSLQHLRGYNSTSTIRTHTTNTNDTIFALATGVGRAGVAIIRISGPSTSDIYFSLTRTTKNKPYRNLPPSHKLVVRNIHHPITEELLDSGAGVIYYAFGASYTGEESLEFHIHGGIATITSVLSTLAEFSSSFINNKHAHEQSSRITNSRIRMADPGEFTRRAFENSRLDLSSAEGLHSLIQAETSIQRQVALLGANGAQATRFETLRDQILKSMALVEALIDFSEEDGVEDGTLKAVMDSVDSLAVMLRSELGIESTCSTDDASTTETKRKGGRVENRRSTRHVGEILSSGIRLAIYGPPNAGKSSLLNRLADRNAAIVSHLPGTTRDVLQVDLDLGGYKVICYDTAGIRDQEHADHVTGARKIDEIEKIGMQRARQVVRESDLTLLVLPSDMSMSLTASQEILRPDSYTDNDPDLILFNKSDLVESPKASRSTHTTTTVNQRIWRASVLTGEEIPTLIQDLSHLISTKFTLNQNQSPLITQSRHRYHLHDCLGHIESFQSLTNPKTQTQTQTQHVDHSHESSLDLVLAAEELRYAARAIGRITGRDIGVEEILANIFSTFCIGK
ncbi:related to MSS1 - mitochondrial GTPase involved in expression of COX1 [Melanopsichium pennsylvanicum]|uniref:Related to MSS1 - mitochondrial GTPase involved in expression of COX1 n=1 Tax=Melanopsichium pennsylvanicum TaxID=63383 RepID=A0AAJ4XIT0_9BASI|nr:related to MSS1 - mitochondrial GTPase involved in expression of COX1 [Melanopsichium pennsylvanicum]